MTKIIRLTLTSGIVALSMTSLSLAQGPGGFDDPPPGVFGGPDGDRGMPPFPVLQALDADRDGKLVKSELPQRMQG